METNHSLLRVGLCDLVMASKSDKMDGKLVKVVFAILLTRCAFSTKAAKFKMSAPLSVTYEDTITKSAVNRFACLSLCNEGCRFVVYSNSGPDAGVCDLYYLKDAMYGRLKNLQIASGYIKVYPNDKVFVGIPDRLDWFQSKQNCERLGWKLVSAESPSLLDRTKTLMQHKDFWLGAYKESSGVWRWLSGVLMSPSPFENDHDQHTNKYALFYGGMLDDADWHYANMHVCEITF